MSEAVAEAKADDVGGVFDDAAETNRLDAIVGRQYTAMLKAMHALVLQRFPTANLAQVENFLLEDAATRRILHYSATRVVRITETTRAAIAEQLAIGQQLGLSTWEIANGKQAIGYRGIDGLFQETWRGRPEMVARTELQEAQRVSAIDRYHATGIVDRVQLADGDVWDEACRNRNGKVVALNNAPGLAHPRCTLVLIPVLREGVLDAPPPKAPAAPKPQKWGEWSTVEQAQAAATARYPHIQFGLEGMHIDTVNPVMKQFAKLSDDYPYVNQSLRYIGTYQAQPAPHVPSVWNDNTYAHATGFGQARIGLNPHWFGDPTKMGLQLNRDEVAGFHPKGTASPEAVFTHEFGHVTHHLLAQKRDTAAIPFVSGTSGYGRVSDTVENWSQSHKPSLKLSAYALKDRQEAWAEAFAAQYYSPSSVKQLVYVKKQRELLKALHPSNWTDTFEVVDMHTPLAERGDKLHFIHQWLARFT